MIPFVSVLFFFDTYTVCNYKTLYLVVDTLKLIETLKLDTLDIIYWFEIKGLAANPAKFQIMLFGINISRFHFDFGNFSCKIQVLKAIGYYY